MGIGPTELLIALAVILVLFPRRLTSMARSLGESVGLIRGLGDDS